MIEDEYVASVPFYLVGVFCNLVLTTVALGILGVDVSILKSPVYITGYLIAYIVTHLIGSFVFASCDYTPYESVSVMCFNRSDIWVAFVIGISGVFFLPASLTVFVGSYIDTLTKLK